MMSHIFPTKSALPVFDIEMTQKQMTEALELVSSDLKRSGQHIHLISGSSALPCMLFGAATHVRSMSIMRVSELVPKASDCLARSVKRASKKFGLGANWFNTSLESDIPPALREIVTYRSLIQNDVVFSSEGLTIIAIDHAYALKVHLAERFYNRTSLIEALHLLQRIVYISRGRPLTRGYIRRCYPEIDVSDSMLLRLNAEYEAEFNDRGVVGVNDEFLGWRREGMTPSAEMEEYRKELQAMLERESADSYYFSDEKAPTTKEIPLGRCSEVANIFMEKKHLFAAFAQ
ncbi:hypothetical protein EX30DRAFT_251655 [Ascodesmis nigricans]|uniref:DUF7582 domain-containing protein n=1 Tax=Ascodesmis nigricans TaxID=341454 RepID=A0A4S2MY19_9PEZI|nr:hypothetical protein EX30DRAFT_251655 [Ascodesmis nigricans]